LAWLGLAWLGLAWLGLCAQRYFKTRSSSQVIHRFLPNIVIDDGALHNKY